MNGSDKAAAGEVGGVGFREIRRAGKAIVLGLILGVLLGLVGRSRQEDVVRRGRRA